MNAPENSHSSRRMTGWAIAAGALVGVAYALSPLTVLVLAAAPLVWRGASRDLTERERRWLAIVLCTAVALRLIAIGALFLSATDALPYANFFGDEEFFKRRSVWIRNIGLGVPLAASDVVYAFDDVGRSLHLYVLAFFQAVVGNAPYGIQVLNAAIYLVGALAMFRVVRPAFGRLAAFGGLTALLFLPSLFMWSISALKEPASMCTGLVAVIAAARLIRASSVWRRSVAGATVIGCMVVLQALRDGGLAMAMLGIGGGLAAYFVVARPRRLLVAFVLLPVAAAVMFNRPAVQEWTWSVVHRAAYKHWGQISTPGYTYKLLEPRFYPHRSEVQKMTPPEAVRFGVRAVGAYLTVPLPWQVESRAALAYLPEQIVWYGLIVMMPAGIWIGLRRDALLTCLLVTHATAAALAVALTGGNVGTLVRHRSLALPYIVWLSSLGALGLLRRVLAAARRPQDTAAFVVTEAEAG